MKKIVFLLIFITGINLSVFSLTIPDEVWLSFGFEYGNFFDIYPENDNTVYGHMDSYGANLGVYRFIDKKDTGIFVHTFFAVPVRGSREINNEPKNINLDGFRFQVGLILGPGVRYNLSEDFAFRWAVGLNFLMSAFGYNDYLPMVSGNVFYETLRYDFGVGGDFGIKGNINEKFFLSIGSIITFDFLRYTEVDASYKIKNRQYNTSSGGRVNNFLMFGVRPYITVGFNIYREWNY